MTKSTRKNRRRQKRYAKKQIVPEPVQDSIQVQPEKTTCIACPNCCTPAKWILTENEINEERHQVYFEVHKEIPVDIKCKIVVANNYKGHPLVKYGFMRTLRAKLYDRPEVRTVFGNGVTVYSRRLIRTIFRDKKGFCKMELMVIPDFSEVFGIEYGKDEDEEGPDIVLNSQWRIGHTRFGDEEYGKGEEILYL